MPRRRPICWIFGALLLTSCANEPLKNQAQLEVKPQKQKPKPVAANNNVKTYGLSDNQASQHLFKAESYMQTGNNQSAQKEIDLINVADLSPEQRSKYNLLEAQIALSAGDAEHALVMLETARPKLLSLTDQISYYQSLAFANSLVGNVLPSVTARIRLGALLQSPQQQQDNIATILDMLSVLPMETLSTPPSVADELSGWMALARIFKQRDQAGYDVTAKIQAWRQQFPKHSANAEFLQTYLAKIQAPTVTPATERDTAPVESVNPAGTVAVLLPATGTYAIPGKAIKDGILAAHKQASSLSSQLPLKFYNTEQADIASVYKQAIAEGARQVIGPLVKEQVQTLAENSELTVPVLALNHVENLSKPNLYQFGLSPIDEAEQLVAKARSEGRQTAVILTPSNSQGQRVANYLITAWQSNGGTINGVQSYDPKQHNVIAMLDALLGAPAEVSGVKKPQTVLLSASPEIARELAPQLKYHQTSDLSIYAMPNIYSGHVDPLHDAELGKINFCDIPWLFPDTYGGSLSQANLQNIWQNLNENQIRLPALGIDAYNLVGRLGQLATTPYAGATGHLSLNEENRVTRKLVCAQFKAGVPVASGFIE